MSTSVLFDMNRKCIGCD